ncbi:MAG: trans-octaprenyltranstransferase [Myxococcales bacterium]|nr:trans-octaprenyltranstransferase [Myxococcales bacterium]
MREAIQLQLVNQSDPEQSHDSVLTPLSEVSKQRGLIDIANRLDRIRSWLEADLDDLESALESTRQNTSDLGRLAAQHLLEQPGKRIRPLCVFVASRLGRAVAPQVVRDLAVAAELAHAATLLHDDVIDQGAERRGAPTARVVFGNSASVLGGDHLLIEALRRVNRSGEPRLMTRIIDVIGAMVSAEALQLEYRGRFVPEESVYQRVVLGKTSVLFSWALMAGGMAAGLKDLELNALERSGDRLGLAFQLVDDLLDLAGDPAVTGKDSLLDLREGKLTWPLLVACERDASLLPDLQRVAADWSSAEISLPALRNRIVATGCIELTRQRALDAAAEAKSNLSVLQRSAARDALDTVIDAAVERAR